MPIYVHLCLSVVECGGIGSSRCSGIWALTCQCPSPIGIPSRIPPTCPARPSRAKLEHAPALEGRRGALHTPHHTTTANPCPTYPRPAARAKARPVVVLYPWRRPALGHPRRDRCALPVRPALPARRRGPGDNPALLPASIAPYPAILPRAYDLTRGLVPRLLLCSL